MVLLHINDAFTQNVQALSAIIAIIIALYFFAAYRKYRAQMERQKMLDRFLKD